MRLSIFSTKAYDKRYFDAARQSPSLSGHAVDVVYHDLPLTEDTASLVRGADAVCVFVNDSVTAPVIHALSQHGVKAILLRCAGFNNVDLDAAAQAGLLVANVPSYSPEAVAEYAVALIQTMNRKTHRAFNRVREGNFGLDGLVGRTLHGRTVGVIGTGRIGLAMGRIMKGFGCKVIAYDPFPSQAFRDEVGEYKELDELLPLCDIVTLHCPLMEATRHIINDRTLSLMKADVLLVNTSRGGLLDTKALIRALKTKSIGAAALDVYEGEAGLFYNDHSNEAIEDDILARLLTFPNVIVSSHQAFLTEEALTEIAESTLRSLVQFEVSGTCDTSLTKKKGDAKEKSLSVRNI